MALSGLGDSIHVVRSAWSFRSVLEAHIALDAQEAVAEYEALRAEADHRRRGR